MVSNDQEDDLKWCSVSVKEIIDKGYRLEASIFDVDAKKAWEKVDNSPYESISLVGEKGLISRAFYPGRFKRIYTEQGERIFIFPHKLEIYTQKQRNIFQN